MADMSMNFLDFLDEVYGKTVREQIAAAANMKPADLQKAADAFAPAFLQGLMQMSKFAAQSSGNSPSSSPNLMDLWPEEMRSAMQGLIDQAQKATKEFSGSSPSSSLPFALFQQSGTNNPMEQLHKSFMAYSAQTQLCDQVAKATGLPIDQLQTLFPMLTAYGLMPLMPPKLDDPAGWVDYLGSLGRQNFQRASKELGEMPSPLAAAFEGWRAGFYPESEPAPEKPAPLSDEEIAAKKMAELNDAALEMQTNYMKGLNSLFESYQAGFDKTREEKE
jgi:hypothetical protein